MAIFHDRRLKLRAILEDQTCVAPGSVFDPLSMRIAEGTGFALGMMGGSVAAMAVLAAPDVMIVTLSELAEQCRRMTRASALPLLVDADHGFGNALSARRTVEDLEAAGVAGMTLEDTDLPARYGSPEARLVSLEEAAAKVRAAVDARLDPAFVIVGRTNLSLAPGDEGLARLKAYEAAGADALFLMGAKTREQLDAIAEAVDLPLILGNAPAALNDREYLALRGVRIALQGHLPVRAAIGAMYRVQRALAAGETPDKADLATPEQMAEVLADKDYARWAKTYLRESE